MYSVHKENKKGKAVILSDLHLGYDEQNQKTIKRLMPIIDYCDKHNIPVILLGDIFECNTLSSLNRFGITATTQLNNIFDMFKKVFGKLVKKKLIDLIVSGNHEKRIIKVGNYDILETLCKELDIDYSEKGCVLVYRVGNYVYILALAHGTKGSPSDEEGALRQVRKLLRNVENADGYIMGHFHKTGIIPFNVLRVDARNRKINSVRKFLVSVAPSIGYEGTYVEDSVGSIPSHLPVMLSMEGHKHKTRSFFVSYLNLDNDRKGM